MSDIEQKALALLGEVSPYKCEKVDHAHHAYLCAALRLSVERHEAAEHELADCKQELADFKQKVNDAVMQAFPNTGLMPDCLGELIIPAPKRDPLTEVWRELFMNEYNLYEFVAAMDARGLEIREKNDAH